MPDPLDKPCLNLGLVFFIRFAVRRGEPFCGAGLRGDQLAPSALHLFCILFEDVTVSFEYLPIAYSRTCSFLDLSQILERAGERPMRG